MRADLPLTTRCDRTPAWAQLQALYASTGHDFNLRQAFASPDVRLMESTEDSKSLNRLSGTHIIIAASGMCEAGRIRHHLRNRLWMPQTTVMLAGFQAEGTLGRMLESGAKHTLTG